MRSQIYLIMIRDGRLALTVGAALEDRMLRDGHSAMALVPAVRGPEFADSDYGRHLASWRSGSPRGGHGPQAVALYEDGLLADLASLGLPAYVGVRHDEEPQIARWADDSGAIMLPVATARDLVDAVADYTPWPRYAADLPPSRYRVTGAKPSRSGALVLPNKVAIVAGVAGPLLLAGLPATAMAAGSPAAASGGSAASAGSTAAVDTAYVQQAAPPSGGANNTSTASSVSNWFTQLGTAFNNAMAQYGQAQITNAQANQAFWNAVIQEAPAAYQAGVADGNAAVLPGAAIGGPIGAGLAGAAASETGPGALAAAAGGYPVGAKVGAAAGYGLGFGYGFLNDLYHSLTTSPAGGSTAQPGATSSAPGGYTGAFRGQLGAAAYSPAANAFGVLGNAAGSAGNFGATAGGLGYTAGFGYGFLRNLLNGQPNANGTQQPGTSTSQQGGNTQQGSTASPNGTATQPAAVPPSRAAAPALPPRRPAAPPSRAAPALRPRWPAALPSPAAARAPQPRRPPRPRSPAAARARRLRRPPLPPSPPLPVLRPRQLPPPLSPAAAPARRAGPSRRPPRWRPPHRCPCRLLAASRMAGRRRWRVLQ